MKIAAYLLRFLSILLFGLAALAIPFALIYVMGAIGTGGREAVGELLVTLAIAAIGLIGGLVAWRIANVLSRRAV